MALLGVYVKTVPVAGWARLGLSFKQFAWDTGLRKGLIRHLHPLECVLAGAADRPNLNLH